MFGKYFKKAYPGKANAELQQAYLNRLSEILEANDCGNFRVKQ
jgi:hypothetical protein